MFDQTFVDGTQKTKKPYTILLSPEGKVLYKEMGSVDVLELRRTILANVASEYAGFNRYWKGN